MKLSLLCVIAILTLTSCSQPIASPVKTAEPELAFSQELQEILDSGLEESDGIGISVAVVVPGYKTWVGVSGMSHNNTPITADTLFSAGSITKNFTAVTVLLLAEDGLLGLDDPLSKWLPDYPNIDSSITIRHLLNHTSGTFNFTENPDYWNAVFSEIEKVNSPERVLENYVLEPYFSKGTSWHYSNTGYALLRMIIKKASGSEILDVYRDRLWAPLSLNSMFLAGEETLHEPVAHGWWDLDGDSSYDDLTARGIDSFYSGVGGGVFSTAKDLAIW